MVSIAANAAEGRRIETASRIAVAGAGAGAAPPSAHTNRLNVATTLTRTLLLAVAGIAQSSPSEVAFDAEKSYGQILVAKFLLLKTDEIVKERRRFFVKD
jgi:hypothetical protein